MSTLTAAHPDPARTSALREHAPAIALSGLVLLGTSLFLLGVLANGVAERPFEELGPPAVANGTARYTLALTGHFAIPYDSFVEGSYRFPLAPGDAYIIDCWAYLDLVEGRPLGADANVVRGTREGRFRLPVEDVINLPRVPTPPAPGSPPPAYASAYCPGLYAVFEWPATAGGEANRPDASARFVANQLSESALAPVLPVLIVLGAVAALAGGVLWRRERLARPAEPTASPDESTAETLLRLAERTEAWLARTRRYLVIAGVLGVFLWYPLLLPWAWRAGGDVGGASWARWAFVGGAGVLLVTLTAVWAREFLRLDRELEDWRRRLALLRRREEQLIAELEA